jgi:hypothetical protein
MRAALPRGSYALVMTAVALVTVLAGRAAGYGLEFTPRGDTVQHVSPGGTGEFNFTLTNTGASPDVFEFDCRVVSAVPGWAVVYCVGGQCVEPGMSVYDTLATGVSDTAIKVSVYTTATEGEDVVSLRVRSLGDTTIAESVATRTIVGAGAAERADADSPGAGLRVAPSLVNRQSGASVLFSAPRQTFFRVTLHDAYGRLVQTIADGAVPRGPHRRRWRPARRLPSGVYLVRLATESGSAFSKVVVE